MKRVEPNTPQGAAEKSPPPAKQKPSSPARPAALSTQGKPAAGGIVSIQQHFLKESVMEKIARHCGTDVTGVERIVRDITNIVRQDMQKEDGKLIQCSPGSFVNCIYDAHALKMRIDARQHCYLVPVPVKDRGQIVGWEAQLRPGYKGYLNRLEANLEGFDFRDGLVWPGDAFHSWNENGNDFYTYRPEKEFRDDWNNIVGSFCYIAYWVHGEKKTVLTRLPKKEIDTIRSKAKTLKIWNEWYAEKVLVATIRRACKRHFARITDDLDAIDNEDYDMEGGGEGQPTQAQRLTEKLSSARYNPFPGNAAAPQIEHQPQEVISPFSLTIGGKAVEKEFNTPLQAYNYLLAVVSRHKTPEGRKALIGENEDFLAVLEKEGHPEAVRVLRERAEEGTANETEDSNGQ